MMALLHPLATAFFQAVLIGSIIALWGTVRGAF